MVDHLQSRRFPKCATIPNLVALDQTVWAWLRSQKRMGAVGPSHLDGAFLTPRNLGRYPFPTLFTIQNLVVLGQTKKNMLLA